MARCLLANMLAALLVLAPLIAAQGTPSIYQEGNKNPNYPVISGRYTIPAGQPTGVIDRTIVNCNGGISRPSYLYVAVTDTVKDTIGRNAQDGITIVRPVYNMDAPVYVEKQCLGDPPGPRGKRAAPLPAPLLAA